MVGNSAITRVVALWLAFVAALWVGIGHRAEAQSTLYWDTNGATAGFGSGTNGTLNTSQWWSTNSNGTTTPTTTTTGTGDALNFGTASNGLATGTSLAIPISGSIFANSITFGSASGTISVGTRNDLANLVVLSGSNPSITVNSGVATVFGVGGTNGLIKSGTGVLSLRGSNTYTGGLTIKEGTVSIGNRYTGGTGNVPTGNTITLGDPNGGTAAARLLVQDNSTGTFSNAIVLGTSTGDLSIRLGEDSGTVDSKIFSGGVTGANNFSIINDGGNDNITFSGTAVNNAGSITVTGTGTGNTTIALIGSNVTNVVQNSTSRLVLNGANTYSGTTIITAGTLTLGSGGSFANSPTIVVGSAGSSGAVLDLTAKTGSFTFSSSQTVGGIGTLNIGSAKTVVSQGIWAPGNSIGSNAVTGNLTLSGTSQFELGTPGSSTSSPGTSDFTAVSGTLTLGGALVLFDNAGADGNGSAAGGVYRLFTYGSSVSGSYASVTPTANTRTSLANITYGGSGTGAGQGVFLTVWNPAAPNQLSGTVALGTILKGGTSSSLLSITNTAANNGFSEKLNASFGTLSGVTTNSGSINLLAAQATNNSALQVFLSSANAGQASGTAQVNFWTDGQGTSGLAPAQLASQTVTFTGTFLDPAVASFASGSTATTTLALSFGTVNEGDSVSPITFSLYNLLQTAGYTADLALYDIVVSSTSGPLSTNLTTFNSLASGTSNSWQASVSTLTQGTFSNTWTLSFKSSNNGTVYSGDTPQTLTLTTSVIVVPEPRTLALAGIGIAVAAWARRCLKRG